MHEVPRGRPISLLNLAALLTSAVLGADFVITLLLTNQQHKIIYSDVITPIIDLLSSAILLIAAKQSARHSKGLAIAWGLIGLSVFAFAIGDIVWAILELGLSEPPFPSLADAFYLIYYPLLLAGVLRLPEKAATRGEQIKKILDMGIVMFAAILLFWNVLIGPIVASNAGYPLLEQAILLAYPAGDLVLLWALIRIVYKRSDQQDEDEAPAFFLAVSIGVTIVGDSIYTYQALVGTYVSARILSKQRDIVLDGSPKQQVW